MNISSIRTGRASRANKDRIAELLEALAAVGRARRPDDERFLAV